MRAFVTRGLVTLAALACGCIGSSPPVGDRGSAIIGGTTDTADPGVVLLFAQVPGAQTGSLCTAEIVSPHVVVTAAHCVSPSEVGAGAQFIVYPGSDFSQANGTNVLQVKETHFDPQFSTANLSAGHDIGVAILAQPTSIAPLAMNRQALTTAMQGQPVRLVGYGLDDAQAQTGAGVKRQTTTSLTDFDSVLIHFSDGQHETCNGDSGGPAFMTIGGQEVIVGLTSFGDVTCSMGGYDTRLDAMVSFVDPYIAQNDPGQPAPQPSSPDLAGPPDLGGAPATGGTTSGGGDPTTGGGDPTAQVGEPGAPCTRDSDCASGACGVGHSGALVCVGSTQVSNSLVGGCDASGGEPTGRGGFLILMAIGALALLLARGLRKRV